MTNREAEKCHFVMTKLSLSQYEIVHGFYGSCLPSSLLSALLLTYPQMAMAVTHIYK